TYYVEVFGGEAQTTGNYTLNLQKITPAENDAYAPNDDFESAAVLLDEFSDGKLWGGESDFYRVGLNANEGIELALPERNGDIGLRLYGPDRSEVASNTFGSDRSITYEPTTTGAYFVEVVGGNQRTTGEYTLRSNRTGIPPGTGSLDVSLTPSSIPVNETTTVTVSVTDSGSGNAVTGATVSAQNLGVSATTTDGTGTAVLTLTPNATGEYTVSVSASGYTNATAPLTVGQDTTSPLSGYTNDNGVVDSTGLLDAAADFRNDDIGPDVLLDAAAAFRSQEPQV
ncbi:carboxypeptidase regulatory-like domain-containing protein, partial [Halorubrum ezzemoulense]|uniref:pre-peptidase C-terminal domain-containing protein n=1 Tax=Halorubrum ezzemoulense TaxID=337243 RepID=UPI00233130B5